MEEPRNPHPFVPPLRFHRLTGSQLSQSRLEKDGLLAKGLTFWPLHFADGVTESKGGKGGQGQPADEPPPSCPILLPLGLFPASAELRAGPGGGQAGDVWESGCG